MRTDVPPSTPHARGCWGLVQIALAAWISSTAGAAIPGDVAPPGGDGRHTVADVVRLAALGSGAPATPAERQLANLAPATQERRTCVVARGGGTGAVNSVGLRVRFDAVHYAITPADVVWNPSLPAIALDARNFPAGEVRVSSLMQVNVSFPLPADLHALRFRKLSETAPLPTLHSCSLLDVQNLTIPTATCTLEVREDVHPVLIPPIEAEPWLDDADLQTLKDLVLGRAFTLRSCWDWD